MRGEVFVGRVEGLLGEADRVLGAVERSRILPAGIGGRRDGLVALNGLASVEQVELSVRGGMDGVFAACVGHARHMGLRCVDREMRERCLIDSAHRAD